jgi:hypothetical protein
MPTLWIFEDSVENEIKEDDEDICLV